VVMRRLLVAEDSLNWLYWSVGVDNVRLGWAVLVAMARETRNSCGRNVDVDVFRLPLQQNKTAGFHGNL
jgi:hypothetical protein